MAILTNNEHPVSTDLSANPTSWQQEMKAALRTSGALCETLGLPPETMHPNGENQFSVFATSSFIKRMKPGDPNDPLLLQVLPSPAEDYSPSGFSKDPLRESESTLQPGLIKKYKGRVLLIATSKCAVHCRYCFRRHFPYSTTPVAPESWLPAIDEIRADHSVHEVILSGGDPLTLVDAKLDALVGQIETIPHVERLRIHTRLPVVIPRRITEKLVARLGRSRLQTIVVIHTNHPNEIDDDVKAALGRLRSVGIQLLNQTVLLKRINDDAQVLIKLSKRLLEMNVLPYYLHQLDPVLGTSHFEVSIETGKELIAEMRAELPGYAVPRYVQELAGQPAKTVIA